MYPAGSSAEERSSLCIGYMCFILYIFLDQHTHLLSFKLFYGCSTFLYIYIYIYLLGNQFVGLVYNQGFYLLLVEPMNHEGRLEIQRT